MSLYATFHSWLVGRTNAYHHLYREMEEVISKRVGPTDLPGALVPSSTGEVLEFVGGAVPSWWGVDKDPSCLAACADRASHFEALQADLDEHCPLKPSFFGLVLSVHALHFVADPQKVLLSIANSLVPGGYAVLVVFTHQEDMWECLRRVSRETNIREAWNLVPWKIFDSIMIKTAKNPCQYWSQKDFKSLLVVCGFEVLSTRIVFDGCSILVLARRKVSV